MASFRDAYDLPLTSSSQAAAAHYVTGASCLLAMNSGAETELEAAIAADEGFAMAHAALALPLQNAGKADAARESAAKARSLAGGATPREQAHVEAIATLVEGRPVAALALIEEHLREFPRDALLLRQTRLLLNASGRADRKQAALSIFEERAADYGEDAWFLGNFSFAHNEMFHFETARALAERSFALNRRSGDCVHSLAHVMFETAQHGEGSSFLGGWLDGSDWQKVSAGHLNWHLALFELANDRWDRVTALYEETVRPGKHPGGAQIALADAASLVWRYLLHEKEPPEGARVQMLDLARSRRAPAGQFFADVHKAMALALGGDVDGVEKLAAETRDLLSAGRLPAGPVVPAIIDALGAFAAGDYERAIAALEPGAAEVVRVGGSHAQFDVFNDTLLAAYIRAGRAEQAEPLLRERLDRRPSRQDEAWLQALEALQAAPVQTGRPDRQPRQEG